MSLPSWANQNLGTTFNDAAKNPDAKKVARLKLKRRYVSAGVDTYDANWTTITSYLLDGGIGNIAAGVDDQDFIAGVVRSPITDFLLDNSTGKFNPRSDTNSLWNDPTSVTNYYVPSSLVELELGFELPTGTQYWGANPFISGFIDVASISYTQDNNFFFTAISKLNALQNVRVGDVISYSRWPFGSMVGVMDNLKSYITTNLQTSLSMTVIANSPYKDVSFDSVDKFNSSIYDFMEDQAKLTGSLFGITRNHEVFLTYFNNPYYSPTISSFTDDTTTVIALNFWTATGSNAYDATGNGYVLSLGAGFVAPTITTGKFGNGRKWVVNGLPASQTLSYVTNTVPTTATGAYTMEYLVKLNSLNFGSDYAEYAIAAGIHTWGGDFDTGGNAPRLNFQVGRNMLGENQWYYMAAVADPVASFTNIYVNGTLVEQADFSTNTSLTNNFGHTNGINFGAVEFDSFRFTQEARSAANIAATSARIFGNKLDLSTTTYNFYNYGSGSNILELESYDNGYTRIFNDIWFEKKVPDVYKCILSGVTVNASITTVQVYKGTKLFEKEVTSIIELLGFFSHQDDQVNVASSGSTLYFTINGVSEDAARISKVRFVGYPSGTAIFASVTADAIYSSRRSANFIEALFVKSQQQTFNYANTASVYEYGRRPLTIKEDDLPIGVFSLTADYAEALLAERATPKIRMAITTRFLEGDLDILNRVTVNWQADKHDRNLAQSYTSNAGAITWTSKSFYVLGYEHSWQNNTSKYILREV